MKQIAGFFDLKQRKYIDYSTDIYTYSYKNTDIYVFGNLETWNGINIGEDIGEIYRNCRNDFCKNVSGLYIVVIYDKTSRRLNVYHDRNTSPVCLYYTVSEGRLYLGTSLKTVLLHSGINRELNDSVIEEFVLNGFIYSEKTLIKNVYKLKSFHYIDVSGGNVIQNKIEYTLKTVSKGQAVENFKNVLDNSIKKCFFGLNEINMPLSSGYDSNYNLYIASEKSGLPVNAFSVGGKFGKNELPVVEKNVKCYNNINLKTSLTDDDTLKNLPDIVWRLEGSVYEVGLFLQYELASLVAENDKHCLICGECADQVMNLYYFTDERIFPETENGKIIKYEFSEYPYIFGSFLILKKNGILANSFGIETRYPYLDNDFVSLCKELGEINQKDKRVHVANCNENLPERVINNMSKIGGSTDCRSLFNSDKEIKNFIFKVKNSELYNKYKDIFVKYSYAEKIKQSGKQKIKNTIRNFIFDIFGINKNGRKNNELFNLETEIRECMCIAYLIVFEKLFISGDYDFGNTGINIKSDELL